jgi:PAS domain S-box-containing protein
MKEGRSDLSGKPWPDLSLSTRPAGFRPAAPRALATDLTSLLHGIGAVTLRVRTTTGRLESCSDGVRELFGHDAEELLARPGLLPSLIHPESRSQFESLLADARDGWVNPENRFRIMSGDGVEKWVRQCNFPVRDGNGGMRFFEAVLIEITSQVRAERDRSRLEAELRQARKLEALGNLCGGIAHDFNNILAAIMGYASLAQEELEHDHLYQQYLEPILQASERAGKLTRQILSYARQGQARPRPLDPIQIIRETHDLIRAALPASVSIQTQVPAQLPPVMVDGTQLHQVIMNLCTNAWQAMEKSGGVLELKAGLVELGHGARSENADLKAGPYVRLTVSDTGCGIPSEVLARIFDPFFTTKAEGRGTGMGLAVARGIIRKCGGAITVETAPGKGSRFTVLLPAATPAEVRRNTPSEKFGPIDAEVIVVDDEAPIARVISKMIQRMGGRVRTFTDPHLALQAIEADPQACDLLLTDHTMPGILGLDLARRCLALRPGMPVLLCTGNPSLVDPKALAALDTVQMAPKPLNLQRLNRQVRESLASRPASGQEIR